MLFALSGIGIAVVGAVSVLKVLPVGLDILQHFGVGVEILGRFEHDIELILGHEPGDLVILEGQLKEVAAREIVLGVVVIGNGIGHAVKDKRTACHPRQVAFQLILQRVLVEDNALFLLCLIDSGG